MNTFSLLPDARRWNFLIAIVLMLAAVWTYVSRVPVAAATGSGAPPSPREGFAAPDFTLDLMTGGQVTLSDLRGKVIMVNFWATWCPPCKAETPAIQKVYQDYKENGLVVLGIDTTYQDSEADVIRFVEDFGQTYPILLDRTGEVSRRYLLQGLPSTYFVDRRGVIRAVVVGGPMSETLIRSNVEELLKVSP